MISARIVTLQDWGYVRCEEFGFSSFRPPKVYKKYIPTLLTSRPSIRMFTETEYHDITSLECFLFMGFDEEDYNKAKNSGISETQLYKQAGNSICVNVLEWIFGRMFY